MIFTATEATAVKRQIRTHSIGVWGWLSTRQREILLSLALGEKSEGNIESPKGYGPCPTHGPKCTVLVRDEGCVE